MAGRIEDTGHSGVWHRFLLPLFLSLGVMIASRAAYAASSRIDSQTLCQAAAVISGLIEFASVVLAALFVYPVCYFRGATLAERGAAGSASVTLWLGLDSYRMSAAFTLPESLYYGLNLALILFSWNLALMAVLELACRFAEKKKGAPVRVLPPLLLLPLLFFIGVIYLLSREGGTFTFYLLQDGYIALFRP